MALKPPSRINRTGVVTRGVLEDALRKRREELESGAINIPQKGSVPAGTGFRHVTSGSEDPNAKLVDETDVNTEQISTRTLQDEAVTTEKIDLNTVTYDRIQETSAEAVLIGRGEGLGPGEVEEIVPGDGLEMAGNVLNVTLVVESHPRYQWQSETPATVGLHRKFFPPHTGTIEWITLEVTDGDGIATAEVDVLKNGVTIFSVSTRPSVGAGSSLGAQVVPDDVDFVYEDFFQIEVLTNGSTLGPLRLVIKFTDLTEA